MGTLLDELRAARRAPIAVFHEYRLNVARGDGAFHAFVEGLDDKEYLTPAIRQRAGQRPLRFYLCDGKDGVLKALNDYQREFPGAPRTAFFVDRDFWDILGIQHPVSPVLYVTDFYSIEAGVVSTEALSAILDDFMHLHPEEPAAALIVDRYADLCAEFSAKMLIITAEIVCELRCGARVNLNNINVFKCFAVDDELKLTSNGFSLGHLRTMCGIPSGRVTDEEVVEQSATLAGIDSRMWMRGKFQMALFLRFVSKSWDKLVVTVPKGDRRAGRNLDINPGNVFKVLAGRVRYPESLMTFLRSIEV